jgi:hypothetical protein
MVLDRNGLGHVGITPGECTHWGKFTPYARAIVKNPGALRNLALMTSHAFNEPDPTAIRLLREKRPELHAWTTSASWGKMRFPFLDRMWQLIYICETNAYLPWAVVQRHTQWTGGDPNPGTAFLVNDDGTYEILRGYYLYKQLSTAGQPGMRVAAVESEDPALRIFAFTRNKTKNRNAFVVVNTSKKPIALKARVSGHRSPRFAVARTVIDPSDEKGRQRPELESFTRLPEVRVKDGALRYEAPAHSVTTFYETR